MGHKAALIKPYSRLDKRILSFSQRTITDQNNLSHDCVNASSVNMFKNKIDNYLARAGYTQVEHLNVLEIILIRIKLFIHIFIFYLFIIITNGVIVGHFMYLFILLVYFVETTYTFYFTYVFLGTTYFNQQHFSAFNNIVYLQFLSEHSINYRLSCSHAVWHLVLDGNLLNLC